MAIWVGESFFCAKFSHLNKYIVTLYFRQIILNHGICKEYEDKAKEMPTFVGCFCEQIADNMHLLFFNVFGLVDLILLYRIHVIYLT